MAKTHVGFLYRAASCFLQSENRSLKTILRSYYLMRCEEISKSAVPPIKFSSSKFRCPHCCIEWDKETRVEVKSKKLSKKHRRRLRLAAKKDPNILKKLLCGKELEQICSFCKHATNTPIPTWKEGKSIVKNPISKKKNKGKVKTIQNKVAQNKPTKNVQEINVYANSKDIFSLKNSDNTLTSTVKQEAKVIKNNKRKKKKYAGLCLDAVLATAESQKNNLNRLNLFLKPST